MAVNYNEVYKVVSKRINTFLWFRPETGSCKRVAHFSIKTAIKGFNFPIIMNKMGCVWEIWPKMSSLLPHEHPLVMGLWFTLDSNTLWPQSSYWKFIKQISRFELLLLVSFTAPSARRCGYLMCNKVPSVALEAISLTAGLHHATFQW